MTWRACARPSPAKRTRSGRLLALRARDSRLGYEASNHYFYTVNDLIEKCLQLDWLEGKMEEQTHGE